MNEAVTVIIPSYNPGNYLREAVASVFVQTHKNWRLVIIDDASTDNSLESIHDLLRDSRVNLILNPMNIGQSKSLNIGLQFVETNFFMQLDADDWLFPDSLTVLINEARHISNDVALIIGNVTKIYKDETGQEKRVGIRRKEWGYQYNSRYEILLANLFPWQKFYRTSAIKEVGGWPTLDPYGGRHAEDLFIFLRLIEKYQFHWVDHMIYNYRLHSNNSTNDNKTYMEIVEWAIRDAIKRWGDIYDPVFMTAKEGWLYLDKLIPKRKTSITRGENYKKRKRECLW